MHISKERPTSYSAQEFVKTNRAAQTPKTPVNVRATRGSSWSLRRFRRSKEVPLYSPKEKQELHLAKMTLKAEQDEERDEERKLRERIANECRHRRRHWRHIRRVHSPIIPTVQKTDPSIRVRGGGL